MDVSGKLLCPPLTQPSHGYARNFEHQNRLRSLATAAQHVFCNRQSISCISIARYHSALRTLPLSSCSALPCSTSPAACCRAGPRSATMALSKALFCARTVVSNVDTCRHVVQELFPNKAPA